MAIFSALAFILGLAVGSFLNCLIYRLPRRQKIAGRSRCPYCHQKIAWYDNFPLISFLLLKGRCRTCSRPISWRYPLVEFITATGFVFLVYFFSFPPAPSPLSSYINWLGVLALPFFLIIFSGLVVIFTTDLLYQSLPPQVIYFLTLVTFILLLASPPPQLFLHLFAATLAASFLAAIYFFTLGQGLGWGDIKLVFSLGLFLGWPAAITGVFLAFLTGAFVGIILILTGKARMKTAVPFAPFLILGTTIATFTNFSFWQFP